MIYAEHKWKVNRRGEPLAKFFTERQWDATRDVKVKENGEVVVYHNGGWVMTETGEELPTPKPLKKVAQKKKTVTKKKAPAKKKTVAKKDETKKEE